MKKISDSLIPIVQRHCQTLLEDTSGVSSVVLSTEDGFDVVSASIRTIEAAKIAAMSSSMMSICSAASQETSLGRNTGMTINTENGLLYCTSIEINGLFYILTVVADRSVIQAQVLYRCAELTRTLRYL